MKVLFLSHQADFIYGGEVCTLAFMKVLKEKGVEVHFASPAGIYQDRAAAFAKIHTIPSIQFSRKLHLLPRLLPALIKTHKYLRAIVGKEGIDIIHATSLKAMAYAWRTSRHVPVVWHHHDILPLRFRNNVWIRSLAKSASLVLAPSDATRAALLAAGVEASKAVVLSNGFVTREWTQRPDRSSDFLRLLMLGEISLRKGSDLIPAIVAGLEARGFKAANFELLVVGEGLSDPEFAKQLQLKMKDYIKSGMVKFLGRREDIKDIFQTTDILLVPSRQDPLPTVIVEAHLSGVPVIGSSAGGIPEMIIPGQNGFLANTAMEIVEKIESLKPLAEWKRISDLSRKIAVERYEISKLSERLISFYSALRR